MRGALFLSFLSVGIFTAIVQLSSAGMPCPSSEQQDIIVILDSSTSIARADFKKQLAFVNSIIDKVGIGPDANQVGVISFSDNYRLNFHLNANSRYFRGEKVGSRAAITAEEKKRLQSQVTAIRQMGGGTNTHKPLQYVRRSMFTPQRGDRPDKRNVCIVITDGKSYDTASTAAAAKALADDGVEMFALGVGPGADRKELQAIAGDEERVFQATSYDELNDISDVFAVRVLDACPLEPSTTTTPAPLPFPVITGMPEDPIEDETKISLRCAVETTDSDAQLHWYRDGEKVPRTDYDLEGNFVVSFYSFTGRLEDNGDNIVCKLEHPDLVEERSDTVQLQVMAIPEPPVITYNPSREVYDGMMVSITCVSETKDPKNTDVVWIRLNERVPGDKVTGDATVTNTITLPALLSDSAARYECHVIHKNLPEPLIDYASIKVLGLPGPPTITPEPEGPVLAGSRVSLTCVSEGTDKNTQVIWYRDGRVVDRTYSISGKVVLNALSIPAVTSTKEYECRVVHPQLTDDLVAYHTIKVYKLPDAPVIKSPESGLAPNMSITLECTAKNADEDTMLVWLRDEQVIDSTYELKDSVISNEHTFPTVDSIEGSRCEVQHKYLPTPYEVFPQPPVLPGPPEINDGVPIDRVAVGTAVVLSCKSFGTDRDTAVTWHREDTGQPIDRSYSTQGEYIVNEMTVRAADNPWAYECRVTHPQLSPQSLITSTKIPVYEIPGPPIVTNVPADMVIDQTVVKLLCRSRGTSAFTRVIWYRDNQPVDTTYAVVGEFIVNEYEFTASIDDRSRLQCRVEFDPTNIEMNEPVTIRVEEVSTPTVSQEPRSVEDGSDVTLTCRVRHHGDTNIKLEWYHRGVQVDSTQQVEGEYIVNRYNTLASHSASRYNCHLTSVGRSERVPLVLDVYPTAPEISGKPLNAANPGERVDLTCVWPYPAGVGSLQWVESRTKTILSSEISYNEDVATAVTTIDVDGNGLHIYDCVAVGDSGPDNSTLVDRVKVPVNKLDAPIDCKFGGAEMDVVIIIDSSTSLTRSDFKKQIDFVSRFSSAFDIGKNNVQVGLMSFSTDTDVHFYMNDHTNEVDLLNAISQVKQVGGGTNTHLPIQRARQEMFTRRYGDRPNINNLCIVITDGKSYNPAETAKESQLARASGIDMFAIGIGQGVDVAELESIAGSQGRVYYADDYNNLEDIEYQFVQDTKVSVGPCEVPTTTPLPIPTQVDEWSSWSSCSATCGSGRSYRRRSCRQGNDGSSCPLVLQENKECIDRICPSKQGCISISHQADIVFLLDTSSSVYGPDFDKMKLFLADFIDLFNISETQQRVASVTFSDDVRVNFLLDDYRNNKEVKDAFLRIQMHLGGTRTDDAIRYARQEVFSELNGARRDSAKLVFIITDGRSYDPTQTSLEAEMARKSGIFMYSIGIGPKIDRNELETIAGNISQVFHVDSYDDINQLKRIIGLQLSQCYNPLDPIDGGYGPWGEYTTCSVTCGTGTRTKKRVCDSPVPRNGGKDCVGPATRIKRCRKPSCSRQPPSVPGWTDWEYSSPCSVTCGEGVQEVARVCQYEDGCSLGQVERKVIKCQLARCEPQDPESTCGGPDGINVMFASQGINSNGPNSYYAVDLIANTTALLSVDGNRVRTSLTLSDCSCGKNTGYDLTRYRNYEEIYNHLHDLDLGDTASLLRKVRSENNIMPSMSRSRALSDDRRHILVYVFDSNDVITPEAVSEAKNLKLAGVRIYAIVLDRNVDLQLVGEIVSLPSRDHLQLVNVNNASGDNYVQDLYNRLCRQGA